MTDPRPAEGMSPTSQVVEGMPAVVRIGERLDAAEVPAIRAKLDELIGSGARHLNVDLSDTVFIDSAGLASLVRAMITLRRRGGDLELVRPRAQEAWRVFKLTQFDTVFTIHDSLPAGTGTA
jgi:anti-sigma B factor antagonist